MRNEIALIANTLKENFSLDGISAFVFGSAVSANNMPNDIDVLIVYNDPTLPPKIRDTIERIGYMPIHLIFLTPHEESETDFIRKQNCISIFRSRR